MPAPTPLASWRFTGTLRHYQADVLDRIDVATPGPLHIVAPPGSGKTLLGLLLAQRRGARTVVLAPTTTIRAQWVRQAASLGSDPGALSEDPENPGDLTALTYQALSVLDTANPFADLARRRWLDDLEQDGRAPESADRWLADLEASNPQPYKRGIASRSRTIRRQLTKENPETLAQALHPNALELIDRLVARGVETIVLDECHHLLDHWALVVATLAARIRAMGTEPLLIGLTATLPSPDDANEYDNYTSLLGDVDDEVPVPAVVREGNLAPYRDLVRFAEPTRDELAFLAAHAEGLAVLLRSTFAHATGLAFLVHKLQPERETRDELEPPAPGADEDRRLAKAFADDFGGSEAAAAMLATAAPQHPLVSLLPDVACRPPTTDESLRLLARFALDRLLPNRDEEARWQRIRRTLADFGYSLTDRGVRRTRDPVDTMLASSLAKDFAACDILRIEREALGDDRMRALVVTDFAEHGNKSGGLVGAAGALRTFGVMVADTAAHGLRPMLVTGAHTRIAARDIDVLVPMLGELLGVPVAAAPLLEDTQVAEVHAPGVGAARLVRAASVLLTRGTVQVVVGTRGLFGEGWDCPAVNTLIDLTAVATASATQQLRGRTLRLDPTWPEKVSHNWTVTALLPPSFPLEAQPDASRLRRKHARLWGLDSDDPSRVVRGLSIALPSAAQEAMRQVTAKGADASVDGLNAMLVLPPREKTRADWRIGEPYVDREGVSALVARRSTAPVFRTSVRGSRRLGAALGGMTTLAVGGSILSLATLEDRGVIVSFALLAAALWLGIPLAKAWRRERAQTSRTVATYGRIGDVVWQALRRAGRVADVAAQPVVVESERDALATVSVEIADAAPTDQRTFADAMAELFAPVRTPRFLLQTGRGGRAWIVRAVLGRSGDPQYLPVPTAIGRRREDAEAFAALWEREVGACVLHAVDSPAQLALMAVARRGGGGTSAARTREEWR